VEATQETEIIPWNDPISFNCVSFLVRVKNRLVSVVQYFWVETEEKKLSIQLLEWEDDLPYGQAVRGVSPLHTCTQRPVFCCV
jgi:hypothetical protein